jgi:hypothetical protein
MGVSFFFLKKLSVAQCFCHFRKKRKTLKKKIRPWVTLMVLGIRREAKKIFFLFVVEGKEEGIITSLVSRLRTINIK